MPTSSAVKEVALVPQPAARPPKSLVQKLAEVMAVVGRIPKRGHNAFHGYDYATEADIAEAIRGELSSRGVMLLPAITKNTREPVGGKGSVLTTLEMEFTFIDGETGETLTRPWLGAGTDKEDKGAYKAMTGGEKYFLLKTFLMPTGDDPEIDDAHRDTTTTAPPAVAKPEGFDQWRLDLDACADQGRDALNAMWLKSDASRRDYLRKTEPDAVDKLRERAAKSAAVAVGAK